MGLESGAKVEHADDGVGNGEDDEKNGDDGEGCKRLPDGLVVVLESPNTDELEKEVYEATVVKDDDSNHSKLVFDAGEVGGADQDQNRDWDRDNGESKFGIVGLGHNDHKLDNEAEKEEEVELEQCNINLCGSVRQDQRNGIAVWRTW